MSDTVTEVFDLADGLELDQEDGSDDEVPLTFLPYVYVSLPLG